MAKKKYVEPNDYFSKEMKKILDKGNENKKPVKKPTTKKK